MTMLRRRRRLSSLPDLTPGLKPVAVGVPLDLWLLDHRAPFDPELLSWLSEEEWNRAGRFHFPEHRRRYLAAHAILRGLVADRTGYPPSALHFDGISGGKPRMRGKNAPPFSLSYAAGLCLIGIGATLPIGVDIEQERVIPDAGELANLYFTPEERRILDGAHGEKERSLTFLHGWTRKEACLKAIGTGLSTPASWIETHPRNPRAIVAMPSGLRTETASTTIDGHVIGWARLLPRTGSVIAERACPSG